jgi:uncharacterized membrane protein
MGENQFATLPVAFYGFVLWMSAFAYYLMVRALTAHHDKDSVLNTALGDGTKERISLILYTAAIPLAFVSPWIALALYVTVAIMWLIPDRRIESKL